MSLWRTRRAATALVVLGMISVGNLPQIHAASHREAALIAQDPEADQTDFYAFIGKNDAGQKVLNVISAYIPAEEPGAGPNYYRLADDALYEINIENDATMVNGAPVFSGKPNLTYQFHFKTTYNNPKTILSYGLNTAAGPIMSDADMAHRNEVQTYTVMQLDRKTGVHTDLTGGQQLIVPPDNLGHTTPLYSSDGKGDGPPKQGATTTAQLDPYTREGIYTMSNGIKVFVGQRLDGFYFDIAGTFDLLGLRKPGVNSLKGYNVHVIAMQIPVGLVATGPVPIIGLYADAARRELRIRSSAGLDVGHWQQVSRLANPAVNEVFIPAAVRDHWNQVPPNQDEQFRTYIEHPELATLINVVFGTKIPTDKPRTDLSGLLIPDLLKVDTSTDPVRLDMDEGFSRLSVLGGDTIMSPFQKKMIPSGWPNGRRMGDDVVDIALTVLGNPAGAPYKLLPLGDNVDSNGVPYNQVFPFAQTPANGRNHYHDPNSPAL
jgi:hypothetical protein